jgi:hypothetical protein
VKKVCFEKDVSFCEGKKRVRFVKKRKAGFSERFVFMKKSLIV